MAGIKKRGIQSEQTKRYYKGQEVKPTRYVYSSGRSVMAGKIAETDEVIFDNNGMPVPFRNI